MQKEKLTLENIKKDLHRSTGEKGSNDVERYIYGLLMSVLLSAVACFGLKMVWFGAIALLLAAYFVVKLCLIQRKKDAADKQVEDADDRLDIAISVEKLSHLSTETERTYVAGRTHYSEVWWLNFMSGVSWRIPEGNMLYSWSKEYYLSPVGMKNSAGPGNEYYFVTLQRNAEVSFVYPCDFFELDESLKKREE